MENNPDIQFQFSKQGSDFHVEIGRRQVHRLPLLLLNEKSFLRPCVPDVDLGARIRLRFQFFQVRDKMT